MLRWRVGVGLEAEVAIEVARASFQAACVGLHFGSAFGKYVEWIERVDAFGSLVH